MSLEGIRIVAIDDTPSIRTFLRISLSDLGAEFHEAGNAGEGLEKCRRVSPDLVVLDLGLPDRDGLEILPELKALDKEQPPFVVVLTVRKEQQVQNRAFKYGADAYLSKPFMMEDLLDILEENMPASS